VTRRRTALAALPDHPEEADFSDNVAYFLDGLEAAGRSQKTRASYKEALHQLETFLRDRDHSLRVADISRRDIDAFLIHLRQRPGRLGETVS
jgi:site-specific recombinase XerD